MANRVWLVLTGLVLLGVGGTALTTGMGGFGRAYADRPVWTDAMGRWVTAHEWIWPVAAVAGGVVALLGIGRFVRQSCEHRPLRRLAVGGPGSGGTRMAARVAVRAVTADVVSYEGVRRARATLSGRPGRTRMFLRVTCADDADLAGLARRVRDDAMARMRATLDREDITGVVVFRVVRAAEEAGADAEPNAD